MREKVPFKNVPVLGVFYLTERGYIRYRRLPDCQIMEDDMGHNYPATISWWVREDWSGTVKRQHSWAGMPPDVWVE